MRCVIDSPQGIEITDLFIRTLKEGGPPGWPSYTWYEGKEAFLSGKFAMWFDANHQAAAFENPAKSQVSGKVGYLLPPAGPDGEIKSSTWVWSLAMNSVSRNKDAAWRFLAWATSKEMLQRTVPYENINPTRKSVWEDPRTVEATNWAGGEYRRTAQLLLSKYARIRWTPSTYVTQAGDRWAAALQEIYRRNSDRRTGFEECSGGYQSDGEEVIRMTDDALRTKRPNPPHKSLPYLLTFPALIALIGILYPFVLGVYYTFTNYTLTEPGNIRWVGLANYIEIFKNLDFWKAFSLTFVFAGSVVIDRTGLGPWRGFAP